MENEEEIFHKDCVEGEVYLGKDFLFRANMSEIYFTTCRYNSGNSPSGVSLPIRKATSDEIKWLEACEKANKFVYKEEVLKPKEKEGIKLGNWYKAQSNLVFITKVKSEKEVIGHGFSISGWCEKETRFFNNTNWQLATDEEVNERLLKHALENYPIGTTVQSVVTGCIEKVNIEARQGTEGDCSIYINNGSIAIYSVAQGYWASKVDTEKVPTDLGGGEIMYHAANMCEVLNKIHGEGNSIENLEFVERGIKPSKQVNKSNKIKTNGKSRRKISSEISSVIGAYRFRQNERGIIVSTRRHKR